jgi:hypothetical protein
LINILKKIIMKIFIGCSLALGSSILLGKRLEKTIFIGKIGRRKMACIALSLATIDVMAVGGIFLGGVAWALDANDPFALAKGIKESCERFCSPLRNWYLTNRLK